MTPIRLLLGLGLALFAACDSPPAAATTAPALLEQWSGQYGGGDVPRTRLLRTAEEWDGFWRQVGSDRPRALDAARELAVAVEAGARRTGGYAVEFDGIRVAHGELIVQYRETAPVPDMMVTQALTSPWAVAVLPRTNLPVRFERFEPAPVSPPVRRGK